VKSRLVNKAQPVPPIYQPEVAADAVVWAAHHHRREMYVGFSTVQAMWGNKFIKGLLDRYLAKKAYAGQQTSEPEDPQRPDNLWEPVDAQRDFGAHGGFADRSKSSSWEVCFSRHRNSILAGAVLTGVVVFALRGKITKRRWCWIR